MCVFYIKYIIETYQVHLKASHNEIYHQQQKMAIHIFAIMYTL